MLARSVPPLMFRPPEKVLAPERMRTLFGFVPTSLLVTVRSPLPWAGEITPEIVSVVLLLRSMVPPPFRVIV